MRAAFAVNLSGIRGLSSAGTSESEQLNKGCLGCFFPIDELLFCQICSKVSHEGAKGGRAKEQAFQLPRTGAFS
jgi:hypothetical protein